MDESNHSNQFLQYCPTEVLINILSFLKPEHLFKCRQVCTRWKLLIDSLLRSEFRWREYCQNDFPYIYQSAYYKRKPELSWKNLYRSLHLWSKLQYATETQEEFASASQVTDEICDFQILRNGEIGVHTRRGIIYYDFNTLKQTNKGIVAGSYLRYIETEEVILILVFTLDLFVIRKLLRSPSQQDTSLQSVKNFLLINEMLYYVNLNNEIYMCNLLDDIIISVHLVNMPDSVMCLGNKNGLHILTFERNIYTVKGNKIAFQKKLDEAPNLLHALNEYNFLDNLDWRVYFQWMFILKHDIPRGAIRDIIIVKVYGDVIFVGSNSGVFRIYYSPYLNDEFDLLNAQPVKQYNFMERSDCPVLTMTPIIQIDVVECIDSHTVLVCMPKKIAVLNFKHDFGRNSSECGFHDANSVEIHNLN